MSENNNNNNNGNKLLLHKNPRLVLGLFRNYIVELLLNNLPSFKQTMIFLTSVICLLFLPQLIFVKEFIFFSLKWFLMGVISSIGFGTGVPTGLLIVFPEIISR